MQPDLDFFPATVTTPSGGRFEKARLIVFRHRVYAFLAAAGVAYAAEEADAPNGWVPSGLPYVIDTTDGAWMVTRTPGCGCGSVLKGRSCDDLLGIVGVTR